ncbi:Dbl homology domain-containing protein [Phakopsora pachyrhizi]|uniref:Dbl homology domain-containing protein n=1 Tax=Phakopsora pachyrhizi TaxID=170000 RepID=A0AAV0AX10_PHAPC|nr:Dbl homology domain-containing protein [Phakopsora pachyrhizi]CAH7673306.1 Dbl homology domain-containing protein [Phakopsora pachyrhizi]
MGSKSTTETSTNQLPSSSIHSTWRSSRTEAEYKILMNTYGQMEMKRQEVIWELFQTEASFLEGLKMVLSTFCRPLQRSTGDWVDGVPKVVGKLYESLEEIVNLHTGICEGVKELSHQSRLGGNHGMILKVADTYLRFIPRLEIYQPYLVRFEEVNQLIEELSSDQNSDFGEFVRMQSGLEECGRMSLSSFLLKPVQRLMKYPLFFKQLCELTPASHTDSHQTDQLLQSTDSIIQLMQEVKGMEDEYKALKVLENQIKGLPTGFKLAVRDRKLLAEGALSHFKISSSKARAEFEMGSATRSPGKPNSKAMDSSSSTHSLIPLSLPFSITRASFYSRNMQRPLSQISDCSDCSLRSGKSIATPLDRSDSSPWNLPPSINDGSSLRTGSSSQTLDSGSDNSPEQKFNLRPTPPSFSPKVNYGGSTPCNRPNQSRQRTISARRLLQKAKESQVWAFVFSDLMVLCHRSNEGGRIMGKLKYQVNELTAIHHIGLSRVVQVSLTGDSGGELCYLDLSSTR